MCVVVIHCYDMFPCFTSMLGELLVSHVLVRILFPIYLSPSSQEIVNLVCLDMRMLCVIKMYALLVNDCWGTEPACYYCSAGYNMLVLLVVFVRHVSVSNMFALLDKLGGL